MHLSQALYPVSACLTALGLRRRPRTSPTTRDRPDYGADVGACQAQQAFSLSAAPSHNPVHDAQHLTGDIEDDGPFD
jgi:hypothetical protein